MRATVPSKEQAVKWLFLHELHCGWQWQHFDAAHVVVAQGGGFATHDECVQDAKRHGYVDAPPNAVR
jgi:hypothetical protein